MEIKFRKKYQEGTRWPEIMLDFMEYLSGKYGYTIDSYDVSAMPEEEIMIRLGKLLDGNKESVTYTKEYRAAVRRKVEAQEFAEAKRRKMKKAIETMLVAVSSSKWDKGMEDDT